MNSLNQTIYAFSIFLIILYVQGVPAAEYIMGVMVLLFR